MVEYQNFVELGIRYMEVYYENWKNDFINSCINNSFGYSFTEEIEIQIDCN